MRRWRYVAVLSPFPLIAFLTGYFCGDSYGAFIGVAVGVAVAMALTSFFPNEWLVWLDPPNEPSGHHGKG
jgi:hypothetical protein